MDNTFDKLFYSQGDLIGGVDESGVSDIAGPLVAACVILPKIDPRKDNLKIFEVDDSKKIPEKYRKSHVEVIWQTAIAIGIGEVSAAETDYLGKQAASSLAMLRAIIVCKTTAKGKSVRPNFLIIDGTRPVQIDIKQCPIQDADKKSLCVASASIIAKVYRDDIMNKLHEKFPYYKWNSNKGYPCEDQFKGLDEKGVQIGIHRVKSWPFTPNQKFPENRSKMRKRRKLWRSNTERNLGMEIGGKLWTTKPPLLNHSIASKD